MDTLRVLARFERPVGMHHDAVPHTIEHESSLGRLAIEFPQLRWDDGGAPSVIAPASMASDAGAPVHDSLFPEPLSSWGHVWSWDSTSRTAAVHVSAVVTSIEVDLSTVEFSGAMAGPGHPRGNTVRALRIAMSEWRERFTDWVSLIAGQSTYQSSPAPPKSVISYADDTVVWAAVGGKLYGSPSYQADEFTIFAAPDDESVGVLLDEHLLRRVCALVESRTEPSTQLRLLRDGRLAIRRGDYRLAMTELASAAELCLWRYFETTSRPATEKERDSWTLGVLLEKCFGKHTARYDELVARLARPRNRVMHHADRLTHPVAIAAFELVRQLVSAELDEPLPFATPSE